MRFEKPFYEQKKANFLKNHNVIYILISNIKSHPYLARILYSFYNK